MPPQPTMAMPIGFMNVSGEYGAASNKDKRGQSVRSEAAVNCLAGWTRRPTLPPMNLLRTFNLAGAFLLLLSIASNAAESRPNFVIIFTDDQGYQDVGCFGSPNIKTPNLDRMAREGMRFTDFYVGQPGCTASRAAFLTRCYPNRIGLLGALGPKSKVGISDKELT